jgi:hypothetical protein
MLVLGIWRTVHCGTVTGRCGLTCITVEEGLVWEPVDTTVVWLTMLEVNIEVIVPEVTDDGKTAEIGRGVVGRLTPAGGAANLPRARVFSSLSVLG